MDASTNSRFAPVCAASFATLAKRKTLLTGAVYSTVYP